MNLCASCDHPETEHRAAYKADLPCPPCRVFDCECGAFEPAADYEPFDAAQAAEWGGDEWVWPEED